MASENAAPKNYRHAWRMLDAADQFLRTAERCHESFAPVLGQPRAWLAYPEVVNYAFAAELALKGLQHVHLGRAGRGHDLEKLYVALPIAVQERVRGPSAHAVLFVERLHDVRDAFEVWRYAYEAGEIGISLDFMAGLARSTVSVLIEEVGPLTK